MYRELFWYAEFAARLVQECAILVPGWELKWSTPNRPLHPTPDKFDFTVADQMAKFAKDNGMIFRGHTQVLHLALRTWFEYMVTAARQSSFQ